MVVHTDLLIAISGAGTVVSTVKYISSSYDDGPYCPVYNLIVGMVVHSVLYLASFVKGIGGPACPVYSFLCRGNGGP